MYKYDTHVHTREVSPCGHVKAREVVQLYKEMGYDGIIITDHYYDDFFQSLGKISWEDKIETYLDGYKKAVEEGNKIGITVLLGIELRFTENYNDYLLYGMTEEFLKENPELYTLGLKEFSRLIEKQDILLFQAHPYRKGMEVADPQYIHGIEVFNGNPRHDSKNHKALSFARKNSLLMSSGSDFHQVEDVAKGGILVSEKITNVKELVKAMRNNTEKNLICAEKIL